MAVVSSQWSVVGNCLVGGDGVQRGVSDEGCDGWAES